MRHTHAQSILWLRHYQRLANALIAVAWSSEAPQPWPSAQAPVPKAAACQGSAPVEITDEWSRLTMAYPKSLIADATRRTQIQMVCADWTRALTRTLFTRSERVSPTLVSKREQSLIQHYRESCHHLVTALLRIDAGPILTKTLETLLEHRRTLKPVVITRLLWHCQCTNQWDLAVTIARLLHQYSQQLSSPQITAYLNGLCQQGRLADILDCLARDPPGFEFPNPRLFARILRLANQPSAMSLVQAVARHVVRPNFPVNLQSFNSVLSAALRCSGIHYLLKQFSLMPLLGLQPDAVTCSIVLKAIRHPSAPPNSGSNLLQKLPSLASLPFDQALYADYLWTQCQQSSGSVIDQGVWLALQQHAESLTPSTLAKLLQVFRQARDGAAIQTLYSWLKAQATTADQTLVIRGFSVAIRAVAEVRGPQAALPIEQDFLALEIEPDIPLGLAFASVHVALRNAGRVNEWVDWMHRHQDWQLQPLTTRYTLLAWAVQLKDASLGTFVFDRLLKDVAQAKATVTIDATWFMLPLYAIQRNLDKVQALEEYVAHHLPNDRQSLDYLVHLALAYSRLGEYDRVLDLLPSLAPHARKFKQVHYHRLLQTLRPLGTSAWWDLYRSVYDRVPRKITVAYAERSVAVALVSPMPTTASSLKTRSAPRPTAKTFMIVFDCCLATQSMSHVQSLLHDWQESESKPSPAMFEQMLQTLLQHNQLHLAFSVSQMMITDHVPPSSSLLSQLAYQVSDSYGHQTVCQLYQLARQDPNTSIPASTYVQLLTLQRLAADDEARVVADIIADLYAHHPPDVLPPAQVNHILDVLFEHAKYNSVIRAYSAFVEHQATMPLSAQGWVVRAYCQLGTLASALARLDQMVARAEAPIMPGVLVNLLETCYDQWTRDSELPLAHQVATTVTSIVERDMWTRPSPRVVRRLMQLHNACQAFPKTVQLWRQWSRNTTPLGPGAAEQAASIHPPPPANQHVLSYAIEALGATGDIAGLDDLLAYCRSHQIALNGLAYEHLVVAYCRQGDADRALRVFTKQMTPGNNTEPSFTPTRHALIVLLRLTALQKRDDVRRALLAWLAQYYPMYLKTR
ncbi:hypothetical protein H4R35_000692 [Dimargaris xerosporica]|nr:hypothetical protein H4R35_000692 [Dimargaris xerosporica]